MNMTHDEFGVPKWSSQPLDLNPVGYLWNVVELETGTIPQDNPRCHCSVQQVSSSIAMSDTLTLTHHHHVRASCDQLRMEEVV